MRLSDELRALAAEWHECCGNIHEPLLRAAARIDALEAEVDVAAQKAGILTKMLHYVAFVLTGDEKADAQLAADHAKADRDALAARVRALEAALVLAAIPLEALHASEADGIALCADVKRGIAEAVAAIRAVVSQERR